MRTPEQISNLRKVLVSLIGPFALFASEEQINAFADELQRKIDSKKIHWAIKCRLVNMVMDWSQISEEPTEPYCSKIELKKKVEELFSKYPKLIEVMARDINDPYKEDILIFKK